MDTETHKVRRPSRASELDALPLGESVALCRRIDLTFGLSDKEKKKHTEQVRGTLDSQIARVRRKHTSRRYTVESLIAPTSGSAALVFIAVATRTK